MKKTGTNIHGFRVLDNTMALFKLWNIFLCLFTPATGSTLYGNSRDIIDATAGKTFIIRTWSINDGTLSITVKKGNSTCLKAAVYRYADNITSDQNDRLVLKYNPSLKAEVSLMFDNLSIEDEGLYEIEESVYRVQTDTYERKDGTWSFQLNVIEHEEMQRCVGDNITLEFSRSPKQSKLHLYNQTVAIMNGSDCTALIVSPFNGRLRCTSDELKVMLIVDNVTQRDAGLYKRVTDGSESGRWFLNITDKPTFACIGDNVTIGWYYNQQEMNRTLRIIHPNEGVMMILEPSNNSTIKSNFQHRLLYSGDISRSYMSFILLNVSKSDTGVYTIETQHGNSIPGRKKMIVEDIDTTSTTSSVKFDTSSIEIPHYAPTNSACGQRSTVRAGTITTRTPSSITRYTRLTDTPWHDTVTNIPYSQPNSMRPVTEGMPIDVVIPVVTAAVGVIMAMIGCLLWIQRKNSYTLEAVQRLVIEKCETTSFATPSTIRRPQPMPPREEGWTRGPAPPSNELIPTASNSVDTAWYSTHSLSELEDDKPCVDFIANLNGLSERNDEKISVTCDEETHDDILDSCPFVCILESAAGGEEHNYNRISDGDGQRQVSQSFQALYAKVKKGPRFSFRNTTTGRTDGLCGDGYEMVDFSQDFIPDKTLQHDSIDSESTKSQTPSCHGILSPRNEFVHGANEDDGYESVENVINMRSAEHIRDEYSMAIEDGEPQEEKRIPGITCND